LDIENNSFYTSLHSKPVITKNIEEQAQDNERQSHNNEQSQDSEGQLQDSERQVKDNKEQRPLLLLQHKLHDITNSANIDITISDWLVFFFLKK
ncbi:6610_t:CDS:1, partial [Scutellospora calospora]